MKKETKLFRKKKRANRASHRYNRLPLLPSGPGGVQQELVVPACRGAKIEGNAIYEQGMIIFDEEKGC
jgi:hypothetical protein